MLRSNKSARLRLGRASEEGGVYLLTAVVEGREPIFADWQLGRLVVGQFREAHEAASAAPPISGVFQVMPQ
ncbi:hypothetical protein SAMN04515675_0153 [Pseudomonas costantinii]|uniref:Uncharacterized protein n=1 Tax=Pseudomonas costantinii TaxID=168469 RepID=A0A1H4YJ06_9PSED|nr:hypothetical protein SAMN04515675_0153 [Pseudomonas costantinii]